MMGACSLKKMSIVSSILFLCFADLCGAWQPDTGINRAITTQGRSHHKRNSHIRRSIFPHKSGDDNGNHSSRFDQLQSAPTFIPDPSSAEPNTVKVHQPREDPRLFYQSATYLKEVNRNKNSEVTAIFPGKDEVRANKDKYIRLPHSAGFSVNPKDVLYAEDICVTCPHDRTLIAKPGHDRVMLESPPLKSCNGYKLPKDVKLVTMYGPKSGTLLQKGSYAIVGQIRYKNDVLRYCTMNVGVLMQTCPVPRHLIADCKDGNNTCSFKCRHPGAALDGSSTLACSDDMTWAGQLPVCSVRSWCKPLPPPAHGRISCRGNTLNGWGLSEGTTCRIKCARGWEPNTRPNATCRRGTWSRDFTCLPNYYI